MRKTKNRFVQTAFIVMALAITVSSCNKDEIGDLPSTNTITDVVVNGADFSTLESAVLKAGLETTLKGDGPFTVFAPNNAAFAASGISQSTLDNMTAAQVEALLLYHTINTQINAADVPAGPNAKVVVANGDSIFVTSNTAGVFVNGIKVNTADVSADNGVIHVLDKVLLPATGNTVETAISSGLDSLVKAVTRATNDPMGDPTLAGTLSSSILTVFAPTNAAFTALLTDLNLTDINDIPIATLLAVLQYHVVGARAFSSDLSNGTLTMLNGSTTIDLTGSTPTITGASNAGNASNITATNILTRNGVVHLIDRVLLP
jgi:uncharacterized surface protein with fasciclin (FAS1) repeats